MTSCNLPPEVADYFAEVREGSYRKCKDQYAFCDYVQREFQKGDIYVDTKQLEKYLDLQKYFDYELFPWEKCLFALHNCTYYRKSGALRWPDLFVLVGRGAGKNGYLAFEDFCLLTPVNGVQNYDIDICANSEDQARTTFDDIYGVLEANRGKMERHFKWTKEKITNVKTNSTLRFRTSNAKTKDGGRPGKVDFDERHAYENYESIEVFITGLGKKRFPRTTIITTNGKVRGGPLDNDIAQAMQVLYGDVNDNGFLPFICRLDSEDEVDEEENWYKANPSLQYFPELLREIRKEYRQYKLDPVNNSSFMIKRMNLPKGSADVEVTSWDNILATNRELPDLAGYPCVAGIDYAKTTDFVAAGLLFLVDGVYYWKTHTWVCSHSADLGRIKAPLYEWEEAGLLTFVDAPEVSPEIPAEWLAEQAEKYEILCVGIDLYRYTLLSRVLKEAGFDPDKGGMNNLRLIRKSNQMLVSPIITSAFVNHSIVWGDNPLMRWYTNNTCVAMTPDGNIRYEKIEPKSRKTDGFMAFVAAMAVADILPEDSGEIEVLAAF